jgi:hypothetical protein
MFSVAVWATSASVSWTPSRYTPYSIVPGTSTTTTVTFTNNGPSDINGKKLALEVRGDVAELVSVTQPSFPAIIVPGQNVSVNLMVTSPSNAPMRVVDGTLALLEVVGSGTKNTFSKTLPIEITISPFSIPPAPDKVIDESTVLGVDANANGVPDRVDRFIAFTAPNSEKQRVAMTLSAKAQQDFFKDYLAHPNQNPNDAGVIARVLAVDVMRGKAEHCSMYTFGVLPGFSIDDISWINYVKVSREIQALYMDSPNRTRAFWDSEKPLVATGGLNIQPEQLKQECLDIGFDPDQFPN